MTFFEIYSGAKHCVTFFPKNVSGKNQEISAQFKYLKTAVVYIDEVFQKLQKPQIIPDIIHV